jgi:hypothetical protein
MNAREIFAQLFDVGVDVMIATVDAVTGILTAQIGDASKGIADSSSAEIWQTWGFASMPSPPTPGSTGAQALVMKRGVLDILFAGRDARAGQIYGNMKAGEACVFATGADGKAQGRVLLKQDGSITLYTTDTNAAGGNAVFLRVSPTNGLEFVSPWGKLSLGPNGYHCTAGAAHVSMGSVSGLPGAMAALGSYYTVIAAAVTLDSPALFLGSSISPLGYNPVAFGIAANPLTTPGVPILTPTPASPIGLFTSGQVFVAGP